MSRYLLDTNAAADCIFRRKNVHERVNEARDKGHKIGIGVPVLAELLGGIEHSASREKNLDIVNRNLSLFRMWPFDVKAAREYGRIFAELRRLGRPIQAIDIQIAAIALTLGNCTVISADSDLSAIPGLTVENWRS
ncbi:MAG: type II toxin-antitoxin system VapC family toxin [Phycisphaerales bacterium]|nr:type II toxin-antitoxin system VapC family toxin [Phycisphaerales bacterium]